MAGGGQGMSGGTNPIGAAQTASGAGTAGQVGNSPNWQQMLQSLQTLSKLQPQGGQAPQAMARPRMQAAPPGAIGQMLSPQASTVAGGAVPGSQGMQPMMGAGGVPGQQLTPAMLNQLLAARSGLMGGGQP